MQPIRPVDWSHAAPGQLPRGRAGERPLFSFSAVGVAPPRPEGSAPPPSAGVTEDAIPVDNPGTLRGVDWSEVRIGRIGGASQAVNGAGESCRRCAGSSSAQARLDGLRLPPLLAEPRVRPPGQGALPAGPFQGETDYQCRWTPQASLPTVRVSPTGVYVTPATALASSFVGEVNLLTAQQILADASRVGGVRILFQRGGEWLYDDALATRQWALYRRNAMLVVRASGANASAPIVLGVYGDEDDPAPVFEDASTGSYYTSHGLMGLNGTAIWIEGAQFVQVEGLEIRRFNIGVAVSSFFNQDNDVAGAAPGDQLRGARNVNIVDMEIHSCGKNAVIVYTPLDSLMSALWRIEEGALTALVEGQMDVVIPVDPNGWWPERVCVENCVMWACGDGSGSNNVFVNVKNYAAYVTVRHSDMIGVAGPTRNACGGWVWGNDGVTAHVGGGGLRIEKNRILNMAFSEGSEANCRADDGDGIDLKDTWNRTYYEHGGRLDIPTVIVGNLIAANRSNGILIQSNTRGVHVYGNTIAYNCDASTSSAGIGVHAGRALADTTEGGLPDYDCGDCEWGPGLAEDIFIYRNMIYRTGHNYSSGAVTNANGISVGHGPATGNYHGSYRNIWIINNTIAYSGYYGLWIQVLDSERPDRDTPLEGPQYFMEGLHIINNIMAYNNGNSDGLQLLLWDELFYSGRGFICSSDVHNNCYFVLKPTPAAVIRLIVVMEKSTINESALTLRNFQLLSYTKSGSSGGMPSKCGPFGVDSIYAVPKFQSIATDDYHIRGTSECVDAGVRVPLPHIDTGRTLTAGPDYDGQFLREPPPDIGADEVVP